MALSAAQTISIATFLEDLNVGFFIDFTIFAYSTAIFLEKFQIHQQKGVSNSKPHTKIIYFTCRKCVVLNFNLFSLFTRILCSINEAWCLKILIRKELCPTLDSDCNSHEIQMHVDFFWSVLTYSSHILWLCNINLYRIFWYFQNPFVFVKLLPLKYFPTLILEMISSVNHH